MKTPIAARALPMYGATFNIRPATLGLGAAFASQRTFATSVSRYNVNTNTSKNTGQERVGPGTEGLHMKDTAAPSSVPVKSPDRIVKGDWVLFHPVYTPDELRACQVLHRECKTMSDSVAYGFVKLARWAFDLVSGYKHKPLPPNASSMSIEQLRKEGCLMDDGQWLKRILFLESIAAVPGMVAATLRHLRSLRLMRRDSGWIHTLLEEAENERMHLMTFMTLKNPSILFRAMVLGAQGIFYNAFFFSYLISPQTCHRFVGHLEEEAVITYTRCIQEIEAGRIPEWTNRPAPEIAKDYWRLGPDAKILDVIYAVRSDESTHRFVNHSLANLKYGTDVNPFALQEPDMTTKGSTICFDRNQSVNYLEKSKKLIHDGAPAA
ncbi:alternative oxidase [Lentinus tigrinus ALCF2SS1-7]|uniref:alternative oxidase n=1 Tax=Lentinus tigrinus ALCF2SS1-7 TaxID=1328758 RepID=UPI0011661D8C|nr:alternative oxidase [Lentinus tigrinus ALCF2SS1-7]